MTPDDSLQARCLALTGSFETSKLPPDCFSGITGNFDGMGMSFGALQWNLGQGTLQPLLLDMSNHYSTVQGIFEENFDSLMSMLRMPTIESQLAWAQTIQPNGHLDNRWKSQFWALGQTPEFQQIQIASASKYYQRAQDLFTMFGLTTERGMALCFDIRVQNGGTSVPTQTLIESDFSKLPPDASERDKLIIIANRRAEASNPRFVEDVRNRKLCIARGAGSVHGVTYNLEATFGIRMTPVQNDPVANVS